MRSLEAKAPLYSHVLESLDGMASIRAYGWGDSYMAKNLAYLDTAQKPYYLLSCVQQWLTVVLGLIVAVFTTFLTVLAVVLHGKVDAGFFGIALVSMEGFAHSLASLVSFWTKLETSLGAVSRVKTFSEDTPREESIGESVSPPAQWPSHGMVEFRNWTAYYTEFVPPFSDQYFGQLLTRLKLSCTAKHQPCHQGRRKGSDLW